MSGGLTDKLRGSLEGYLARSAAELDERGAQHAERTAELEAAAAQLEDAERELDERTRRLEELGPMPARLARAVDEVLTILDARAGKLADESAALQDKLRELAEAEAELAARERMFTEKELAE